MLQQPAPPILSHQLRAVGGGGGHRHPGLEDRLVARPAVGGGSMGRATPPFRADHVGSLLRPRRLLHARDDHAAGRISAEELRAVEDDAIRDVVRDAARRRSAVGHRRRVPPRLLAHGLHLPARRGHREHREQLKVQFRNPAGTIEFTVRGAAIDGKVHLGADHLRRGLPALQAMVTSATAQAHHPVAEHGPLPRRPGGDRPRRLPRRGAVLERPERRLCRAGPPRRRAGLHLPAVRRHQPGLPQRPRSSGR